MTDLTTLPISETLKSYAMDTRKVDILSGDNPNLDFIGPSYVELPPEAVSLMQDLPPVYFSDDYLEWSDYTLALSYPFSCIDVGITFWNASNEVAEGFLNHLFTLSDSNGINTQIQDYQSWHDGGQEPGQFTYIYHSLAPRYDAKVLQLVQSLKGVNLNLINFPDYLIKQIQNTTDCTYAQVIINQSEFSLFEIYNPTTSAPLNTPLPSPGYSDSFPSSFLG